MKKRAGKHRLSKEDHKALLWLDDDDQWFITQFLASLRKKLIAPRDYGFDGVLRWSKRSGRYILIKQTDREWRRIQKKGPAKFSYPEPTMEDIVKNMPLEPVKKEEKAPIVVAAPRIDRKAFIEGEFTIVDKDNREVPFKLRYKEADGTEHSVQEEYYNTIIGEYGENLAGTREIILKSRQEGFSSLILALFAVDFLTLPNSISICISHDRGATEKLFRKVHHYVDSYCKKNGFDPKEYLSIDTKEELGNATNNAYFYIKTAGAKVGARGGTATNLHLSEVGFFQNTDRITASEIVEASMQQIPQGKGMVFMESTGNNYGDYFQLAWERAKQGQSVFKPRFFSWEGFYTDEFIQKKRLEYEREEKFLSDYPKTDEEAFIHSGSPFFDRKILQWLQQNMQREPLRMGRLATDGELI